MAPESSKSANRRPRHAFKPPLPAAKSRITDAASRRKSAPARAPSFSPTSSEDGADSATQDSNSSDEAGQSDSAGPPLSTQDPPPNIPPKLLTRLLHYHSEKSGKGDLKIEKEANALVGKYMETFILEAIARAAYERSQADGEGGAGDGFLEHESRRSNGANLKRELPNSEHISNPKRPTFQPSVNACQPQPREPQPNAVLRSMANHVAILSPYYLDHPLIVERAFGGTQYGETSATISEVAIKPLQFSAAWKANRYGSSSSGSDSSGGGSAAASAPASAGSATPSGMVKVHVVKVSNKKGDLKFEPNSMDVNPGEAVQFHFYPKNHSVVQSTFDQPCVPISNIMPQTKGIFSGFMPVKPTDAMMPSFTIVINDTKPIWYYCSQGDHCQDEMVGVINPPKNNQSRTIDSFTSLAKDAPANLSPGEMSTGQMPSYDTPPPASTDSAPVDSTIVASVPAGTAASLPPAPAPSSGGSATVPIVGTNSSGTASTPSGTAGGSAVQSFVPGAGNVFAARLSIISSVALAGIVGLFVTLL
ncbi:MAG: hypothetical protein Q9167_002437 [Letrouitia subvulpina]